MADVSHTRNQAIQDFQQRLVLLYHASTCCYSNDQPRRPCRASPRCFDYVQLLRHCQSCECVDCIVPHCVSTRYLLVHRNNCQSDQCVVCKPLRESIERRQTRENKVVKIASIRSRADFETSSEEISESSASTPRSMFGEHSPRRGLQLRHPPSRLVSPREQFAATEDFGLGRAGAVGPSRSEDFAHLPPPHISFSSSSAVVNQLMIVNTPLNC